jgi:hypothetical protein
MILNGCEKKHPCGASEPANYSCHLYIRIVSGTKFIADDQFFINLKNKLPGGGEVIVMLSTSPSVVMG